MIKQAKTVTVSLVTYNGMAWLPACLASVRKQTLADLELLVVDNASTDGSAGFLRDQAAGDPRVNVFENPRNMGFAAGHNRNIRDARAEFVMLLNQDTVLDPGFLAAAVAAFDRRPRVAAVQGRLRRLGPSGELTDKIDSTGLVMHRDRRVVARRQGVRESDVDLFAGPVWGADGPAPVYLHTALVEASEPCTGGGWEVLDEDFFMYKEDIDLAWRLRRLGWTAWYEPKALAWHARGTGRRDRSVVDLIRADRNIPRWIKAVSWRNHRLMQLKNERPGDYVRDLPWILRREILSLGFLSMVEPRCLEAIGQLIEATPRAFEKRKSIADTIRRIEAERTRA